MKNKLLGLITMLFMTVMLTIPVKAAEYGVVYDETEQLYTEELELLGTEILPQFTEDYGIDLRVDVLTGIGNFETIEDAAAGLYENYEYGSGEGKNGASLTIHVFGNEDGYEIVDWHVYFAGDNEELKNRGPLNISEIEQSLSDEAWSGNMEQDAYALTDAVNAFVNGLESFVLSGDDEEIITFLETEGTKTEVNTVESGWMSEEAQLDHVTDSVGLLSEEQWQELEKQARAISEEYDFEVYAVIVDNYLDYSEGSVQDAAEAIYTRYSLGSGAEKDGLMLLLSMNDRDYSLITHGSNGNYTFNDEGRVYLTEYFLDDFAENDWYKGLADYFVWSSEYLSAAKSGEPYSDNHVPMSSEERMAAIGIRILIILLVPFAIAGIYVASLTAKMKSVAEATKAAGYIAGELQLKRQTDQFVHATETRTKISSDSNKGSGGSSRSGGSSGFSGTSGKF